MIKVLTCGQWGFYYFSYYLIYSPFPNNKLILLNFNKNALDGNKVQFFQIKQVKTQKT